MADEACLEPVPKGVVEEIAANALKLNLHPEKASEPLDGDHRFKIVHFVRHGEGYHNIGFESLEDTHLTAAGWAQGAKLQQHIDKLSKPLDVQAIFVSPLTRTLETACAIFGGRAAEGDAPVLMQESFPIDHEQTAHLAIATRPGLPFIANEGCRERMSINRCDARRSLAETAKTFPGVDFSLVKTDSDEAWKANKEAVLAENKAGSKYLMGEKEPVVAKRGIEFINWVMARPEKYVAVVSHREWIKYTLRALTADADFDPELRKELTQSFRNCEMRSVVFDKRGKPVDIVRGNHFPGESPRHYLFAVNWTKKAMTGVAGHIGGQISKRLGRQGA